MCDLKKHFFYKSNIDRNLSLFCLFLQDSDEEEKPATKKSKTSNNIQVCILLQEIYNFMQHSNVYVTCIYWLTIFKFVTLKP